ncbi:MAG: hypothetical protein ACKOXB_12210 [Flavobacteriales bacterium]
MKISIDDSKKIFQIQEEFNKLFPYLKIEFFSKPHDPGCPSAKKFIKHCNKTLAECRSIHKRGKINISPKTTVNELEQDFGKNYGLGVQVFRKSGKVWLETTVTDSWTLEEQNKQGEELSTSPQNGNAA